MRNTSQSRQIKVRIGERDILALSFAGLTLCSLLITAATWWSARSCSLLEQGDRATLVQQLDGTAFIANPKSANYRDPELVRNYVNNWVGHTFSLSGEFNLGGKQRLKDRGLEIGGQQIPTNVVSGAYAWSANKRQAFIKAYLQEGFVPEDYFANDIRRVTQEVEIDSLGEARLIDEEKQIFSVNVIATISKLHNGKPTGEVDYYRRKILVASIPLPQKKPNQKDSIHQQLSYQWRKEGLQIQQINPLTFKEY